MCVEVDDGFVIRGIITLEEDDFVGTHASQIAPTMLRAPFHGIGLPRPSGEFQSHREEIILIVDCATINETKRGVVGSVMDRPPKITDLESVLQEQLVGFLLRKVAVNTGSGC